MKKYLVLAAVFTVVAAPITMSSAQAEEKGFFKKQYERFQEWRNSSDEEKEVKKEKAKEKHSALDDQQKTKVKKKSAQVKKRRVQKHKKPNQWENMND